MYTRKTKDLHILLGLFFFGTLLSAQSISGQTVHVTGIEELYAAVNDPGNAGATIALAPGIYRLTALDANNVPRPNGGRLDLQLNMSLVGVKGDRSAVIIDAFELPPSSYTGSPGPHAAVRLGRGTNSVEWLTVRDARNGQANIDSGLIHPGTAFVRIAHVASSGSTRGLNVLNFGPASSNETIEAEIEDNYFFNNTFGLSEGVRVGNFQGAVNATVNARMVGNRSWGQQQGRLIVNNRAINSTVNVFSAGNRFFANGAGTIIVGGLSSNVTTANGNTINFEAHGDHFVDNTGPTIFDIGGLIVLGGENISIPYGTNNNTVNVRLWGCRMGENNTYDLLGIGARSEPESIGSPGANNRVTIEIHGEGSPTKGRWQPVEVFLDALPYAAEDNNSVTVVRRR